MKSNLAFENEKAYSSSRLFMDVKNDHFNSKTAAAGFYIAYQNDAVAAKWLRAFELNLTGRRKCIGSRTVGKNVRWPRRHS